MQTQTKVVFSCLMMVVSSYSSKGRFTYRILKLVVHLCDDLPHRFELGKHVFLGSTATEHGLHLNKRL